MATWISSFFDNELEIAADVRNEYLDYLQAGLTGRVATKRIIKDFSDEIATPGDDRVVWMALAVTQWKFGRLEPRVKLKALKAITDGGDVALYPPERQVKRRRILEKVRVQLESPQPLEKPVRVVKPAQRLAKIPKFWKVGQIVAFQRDSGRFALLLTEAVDKHPYIGEIPTFVLFKWQGRKLPLADRIGKLKLTDEVLSIYPNKKGDSIPWSRLQRLDATHDPSGLVHSLGGGVYCPTGFGSCTWNELDLLLPPE